jgi:SAM-dependent methyltransferase
MSSTPIVTWETLDWPALDRLRAGFLDGGAARGPYWKSPHDLAVYDLTYGERIGWKWDAVLRELRLRSLLPSASPGGLQVLDWGCGSGIAGRRVVAALGAGLVSQLALWDHSALATAYAAGRARAEFPGLAVVAGPGTAPAPDVLVVSHVLNELAPSAQEELRALVVRARHVLWVEPGTHDVARALQGWREDLRAGAPGSWRLARIRKPAVCCAPARNVIGVTTSPRPSPACTLIATGSASPSVPGSICAVCPMLF